MMRQWRPCSRAEGSAVGTGAGLLAGAGTLVAMLAMARWSLREVPVLTFLVIYPAVGAALGYALSPSGGTARTDSATEPGPSPEAQERRRLRRQRFIAWGLVGGCAVAFVATVLDVTWRGWRALAGSAFLNFFLFPYFGVLIVFNRTREPGQRWSLPRFRLNLGMLMLLIGYLALLLGVAVEGFRIGGAAQLYHFQSFNATTQADLFRSFARKSAVEAPLRLENAKRLRAGEIPDSIMEVQKTFLKSLDSAKPDYRAYRFGMIANGEEFQGRLDEKNLTTYTKLTEYYDALAAKYARAEQRPWEPVAPDPPRP